METKLNAKQIEALKLIEAAGGTLEIRFPIAMRRKHLVNGNVADALRRRGLIKLSPGTVHAPSGSWKSEGVATLTEAGRVLLASV